MGRKTRVGELSPTSPELGLDNGRAEMTMGRKGPRVRDRDQAFRKESADCQTYIARAAAMLSHYLTVPGTAARLVTNLWAGFAAGAPVGSGMVYSAPGVSFQVAFRSAKGRAFAARKTTPSAHPFRASLDARVSRGEPAIGTTAGVQVLGPSQSFSQLELSPGSH